MSGTRALFASIGASVLLVGAAALSLLAVSAVFAFGGWSDPVADSSRQTALVLAGDEDGRTQAAGQRALVLPRRASSRQSRAADHSTAPSRGSVSGGEQAGIAGSVRSRPKASFSAPPVSDSQPQSVTPQPPANPSAPKPSAAGDGVRSAGEDLSGSVQNTGDALARITDPLLPPVSAATQTVLNAVAELLRRTTNGVAGAVDGLLAPR